MGGILHSMNGERPLYRRQADDSAKNNTMASLSVDLDSKDSSQENPCLHINPERGDSFLKSLGGCWKNGLYCDLVIKIQGRSINAHKVVLSSASDYFKVLISIDIDKEHLQHYPCPEKITNEVPLHDLDYESVYTVLEYIYTGHINIHQQNVRDILITSDFLQVDFVKTACVNFLLQDVNENNCIELVMFAKQLSLRQLFAKAVTVLGKHFDRLSKKTDFLELPFEVVHELADDDDLVIFENGLPLQQSERELALLRGILKYIESQFGNEENAVRLVKAIRLPFIDKKMLERDTDVQRILKERPELSGVFGMAKSMKSSSKRLIPEKWLTPRRRFLHHFFDQNCDQHVFARGQQTGKPSKWFDDGKANRLNQRLVGVSVLVRLWDGRRVVGGLEVKYSDGTVSMHGMKRSNCNGCIEIREFTLGTDELITKVAVRSGWMIDQLIFHTNKGNVFGPFGGDGGGYKLVAPTWNDNSMTYLHGFSGGEVLTQGYIGITFLRLVWGCIDSDKAER